MWSCRWRPSLVPFLLHNPRSSTPFTFYNLYIHSQHSSPLAHSASGMIAIAKFQQNAGVTEFESGDGVGGGGWAKVDGTDGTD